MQGFGSPTSASLTGASTHQQRTSTVNLSGAPSCQQGGPRKGTLAGSDWARWHAEPTQLVTYRWLLIH